VQTVEGGGTVRGETLLWDDHRNDLRPMRSKEESHDYRYFPDPDLPPLEVSPSRVEAERFRLPELPQARRERFATLYGLSAYDAEVLTQSRSGADYFERVAAVAGDPKAAANWVMGPAQALMNERGEELSDGAVSSDALAEIISLVQAGTISDTVGKEVLRAVAEEGGRPASIVAARGLEQVRDQDSVHAWVAEVVEACPEEVARYRDGEERLLGFLVGQVMRRSGGKADPRQVNEALRQRLAQ
jgi:aspartyl-tRNA(Asn)/glutamyl-tRNA(Gln) amidotransferase subunit B